MSPTLNYLPTLLRRATDVASNTTTTTTSTPQAENKKDDSTMTRNLLIVLITLLCFGLALGVSLFLIRRSRNARKAAGTLPTYSESVSQDPRSRNYAGLSINTSTRQSQSFVYSEKQGLMHSGSPMPMTPDTIPEIRITFPDEEGRDGRRVSGRVMVVSVGEAGVGYVRPLSEGGVEAQKEIGGVGMPPAYVSPTSTTNGDRMASVDIERIGGLKEKELR